MTFGIIGAGRVGQRLARHLLGVGHEVVICNSRQPETLAETVAALGKGARAATLEETARQEVVFLCVWWDTVPSVMQRVATWNGRILVDTTNQLTRTSDGYRPANTDPLTGSELVASMATGARVVKAFNSLFEQYMDGDTGRGNRVLFYAGNDAEAKSLLHGVFTQMGFCPIDLGSLRDGGRLMQVGGALNGKHLVKLKV